MPRSGRAGYRDPKPGRRAAGFVVDRFFYPQAG